MGIAQFHQWLSKNYPSCFIDWLNVRNFDYIYIDVNHILHKTLYTSKEHNFFKVLEMNLDSIFNNFFAFKKIILAVDGPSPYAKIILQRIRRIDTNFNSKLNSLSITPGTNFMNDICKQLLQYTLKLKSKYTFTNVDIELLSADQKDEGEIKIFQKLFKYGNINLNDTHLVVSNDADLVVLGMACSPIKNINILLKISKKSTYLELVKYYQSFAQILKRWFPGSEIEYSGLTTLEPYFGSRDISQFSVVTNPLLLIHAPVLNAEENKYVGLEVEYQGKKISGLRVETRLPGFLKSEKNYPLYDFYYLADVNARVFGFTHGQVIAALSNGVNESKEFDYNGARPWSKHKRYKARDQIDKPIALTNYGHSSKKTYYYVSDHPDFALECLGCANKDVVMTWFFWREGFVASMRKESVAPPKRIPDFIFQVYLSK